MHFSLRRMSMLAAVLNVQMLQLVYSKMHIHDLNHI